MGWNHYSKKLQTDFGSMPKEASIDKTKYKRCIEVQIDIFKNALLLYTAAMLCNCVVVMVEFQFIGSILKKNLTTMQIHVFFTSECRLLRDVKKVSRYIELTDLCA